MLWDYKELIKTKEGLYQLKYYIVNHTRKNCIKNLGFDSVNSFNYFCKKYQVYPMPSFLYYEFYQKPGEQPCFTCRKSTDGRKCCWVRDGTPVNGWIAEPSQHLVKIFSTQHVMDTYKIKYCPDYEQDKFPNFEPDVDFTKYIEGDLICSTTAFTNGKKN